VQVDARVGMLAPPRSDDAAEHEALLGEIGGECVTQSRGP
jgi:hypothetical protein